MKKLALIGMLLCSIQFSFSQTPAEKLKVDALLKKMTLEEKAGQMTQVTLGVICSPQDGVLDTALLRKAIVDYKVGSVLNVTGHALTVDQWRTVITQIQDEEKKYALKYPLYIRA